MGAMEAYFGAVEAHPEALETHPGAVEDHHGDFQSHPGALHDTLKPWRLILERVGSSWSHGGLP
jgi:hypothetical protein